MISNPMETNKIDGESLTDRTERVLNKFTEVWDSQEPYRSFMLNIKDNSKTLVDGIWKSERAVSYLYKEDSSDIFYLIIEFYLDDELMTTYEVERTLKTVESLIEDFESKNK